MSSKVNKTIIITIILALTALAFAVFFIVKSRKNVNGDLPPENKVSIIADLESSDIQKKCVATVNVGREKEQKALPCLIKNINDENSNVAILSVWATGKIRDRRAVDPLIELLENQLDDNADIIPFIAWALGEIGDVRAFESLMDLIEDSPDPGHRETALKALVNIGGSDLTEVLIKLLKDRDENVRAASAQAFCLKPDKLAVDPLINTLSDTHRMVRINAIMALSGIGSTRALKYLKKIARNSTDSDEREKARTAVRNIEIYGRRSMYRPPVNESEYAFIESLDIKKLEDYNIEDCMEFGEMPMYVVREKDIDKLLEQLESEDSDVQGRAAWMLGNAKKKDRRIVPALIKSLKDKSSFVRHSAATSLGKLNDRSAVPHLIEALDDDVTSVRDDSTTALGNLGGKEVVKPVIKMLDDDFVSIRISAVVALKRLNTPRSNKAIIRMLEDPEPSVRRTAARSLGEIGETSNIAVLEKLLTDHDKKVRIVAENAIKKLKEKK
ncbi:MAG: HEAT repeat domain-containing protein [Candidatus Eremiobacteraeota bacterium]|nr:HEAT repeat domain-containing protein [Candidatus Eremiobacteraeota bacterium]